MNANYKFTELFCLIFYICGFTINLDGQVIVKLHLEQPNEFCALMEGHPEEIDSLVLTGSMGDKDFAFLRKFCQEKEIVGLDFSETDYCGGQFPPFNVDSLVSRDAKYMYPYNISYSNSIVELADSAFASRYFRYVKLPANLKELGIASFFKCQNLIQVNLPDGIEEIPESCFEGCGELENLRLPSGLKRIGKRAFYFNALKSVEIPQTCEYIGPEAFADCDLLTSIVFPDCITEIEDGICLNCKMLTNVVLPSALSKIGDEAFYLCAELRQLELPETLVSIGTDGLRQTRIINLTLPRSLEEVGVHSLFGGRSDIYCCSTIPPRIKPGSKWPHHSPFTFKEPAPQSYNRRIFVPKGSLELYRADPNWNVCTEILEFDVASHGFVHDGNCIIDNNFYDILGRRVKHSEKGRIYICNGKKIIY